MATPSTKSKLTRAVRVSLDKLHAHLVLNYAKTSIDAGVAIANEPINKFAGTIGSLVVVELRSGADEALQGKRGQDES